MFNIFVTHCLVDIKPHIVKHLYLVAAEFGSFHKQTLCWVFISADLSFLWKISVQSNRPFVYLFCIVIHLLSDECFDYNSVWVLCKSLHSG